jgi:hypothetical protein
MGMILAILLVIVVGAFALMAWLVYISAMILLALTAACFFVGFMIGNAVFDSAGAGALTGLVLTGVAWMVFAAWQNDEKHQ